MFKIIPVQHHHAYDANFANMSIQIIIMLSLVGLKVDSAKTILFRILNYIHFDEIYLTRWFISCASSKIWKNCQFVYCGDSIWIFTHLKLCLDDAIHNFKEWKLFRFHKKEVNSNLADWCDILSLTCLKGGSYCANKKWKPEHIRRPAVNLLSARPIVLPCATHHKANTGSFRATIFHVKYLWLQVMGPHLATNWLGLG